MFCHGLTISRALMPRNAGCYSSANGARITIWPGSCEMLVMIFLVVWVQVTSAVLLAMHAAHGTEPICPVLAAAAETRLGALWGYSNVRRIGDGGHEQSPLVPEPLPEFSTLPAYVFRSHRDTPGS